MTKDTKTLVAEKVKKLFRLSKSNNEHEAALASQKVHEILTMHGMSLTDVEIKTAEVKENKIHTKFKRTPKWVYQLGNTVAANTYCRMLVTSVKVNFIGEAQDAEVAGYLFEYLYKTVKTMTKKYTKQFYNKIPLSAMIQINFSYASGVVQAIAKKLYLLKREEKSEQPVVTVNGTELVVIKNQVIKAYIKEKYDNTVKVNIYSDNVNNQAYLHGITDGKSISIHQAIDKSSKSTKDWRLICQEFRQ